LNRRRVVEVQSGDPESHDEAVERRNALIKEVQDIQEQLGRTPPKSGLIDQGSGEAYDSISTMQYPAWRRSAITALNRKQAELRRIKDWLRKNDVAKKGEWALLGKAYRLLDAIQASGAMDVGVDGLVAQSQVLLDEIEKTIPGKYLEQ
jgi:hypothetical protein